MRLTVGHLHSGGFGLASVICIFTLFLLFNFFVVYNCINISSCVTGKVSVFFSNTHSWKSDIGDKFWLLWSPCTPKAAVKP